ncbi:VOC family protein [Zhihengliuella salsuginis]|uniref:VOC family protein n=1 Tax=Zhihengliuella salsuginis TaxID=578222 RepID=A0ABQ3GIJ6_9MICC|nr:VOC family protein [Zhihengliuella salsuginis]GHD05622.1 VOC family protein [Zhihengliuella salsuginis]
MTIGLTPYLQFNGQAKDALEFYHSVFGGELGMMTYAEGMGEGAGDAGGNIMHGSLFLDRGIHLMASDLPDGMEGNGYGTISLSSSGDSESDASELEDWWEKLAGESTVSIPLETAPWGDRFGQLTDRFGVNWMFNITATAS